MYTSPDKTLEDDGRRELSFVDYHRIKETLPEFFVEAYPKFIEFLEAYYEYEHGGSAPSRLIHDILKAKDISAADTELLTYIEDELLLGEQHFEGFKDKRAAAKVSSTMYQSKGTLFSMQQFFRMFYGLNPDITYPKKFIFEVGSTKSVIGPEGDKFILNNTLYQKYSVLIKIGIPLSVWRDTFKLFVHPAGMYLGSEIQMVGDGNLDVFAPDAIPAVSGGLAVHSVASLAPQALPEISGLAQARSGKEFLSPEDDLTDSDYTSNIVTRVRVSKNYNYDTLTIDQFDLIYDTINEAGGLNSPTFDEDSAVGDIRVPRFSETIDTMDEEKIGVYDPTDTSNEVGLAT
jgi:hypothetical protein